MLLLTLFSTENFARVHFKAIHKIQHKNIWSNIFEMKYKVIYTWDKKLRSFKFFSTLLLGIPDATIHIYGLYVV